MAGYDRHLSMREQRRDGHDEYETIEQKASKRGAYHQKYRHPLRRKGQNRSDIGRGDSYHQRSSLHRTDQGRGGGRRTASPSPHDDSAAQEQRKSYPEQQVRVRQDEEAHSHSRLEEYKRLRSASPPLSRRRHSSVSRRQARGNDDCAGKHGKSREHSNPPKRNHLSGKENRHANNFIEDFAGTSSRSHPPSDEQSRLTASPRPFAPPFPRNIEPRSRPASRYPLTSRTSHHRSPSASSFHPLEPVSSDPSKPGFSPLPIASECKDSDRQRTNNDEHMRDTYPVHGVRPAEARSSRRPSHPSVDTRQPYTTSPQYVTPTSSRHESPQSASPYSGGGRGSWSAQQQSQPYHGQSR